MMSRSWLSPSITPLTPAKQGTNTVHAYVFDTAGKLRDVQDVTLTAALPSAQIGPLPVTLVKLGPGHYQSTSLSLRRVMAMACVGL